MTSVVLTSSDAHPRLVRLADVARGFIVQSRAPRTVQAYTAQWKAFVGWCEVHGETCLPARPETVALYLSDGAERGLSVATLGLAISAIAEAHTIAGHPALRDHLVVRETLRGIRRTRGGAQRGKAAISADDLRAILAKIPADTLLGVRDRALFLGGFLGGFRRSELVGMRVEHVRRRSAGMVVDLFGNKDDDRLVGREVPILRGVEPYCPVKALDAWLKAAAIESGPVFRSVDRHGRLGGGLAGGSVATIVKGRAQAAGLDYSKISGHSLRAGFVTAAHLNGASLEAIMKVTGHQSYEMAMRYIRKADPFTQHPAAGLL